MAALSKDVTALACKDASCDFNVVVSFFLLPKEGLFRILKCLHILDLASNEKNSSMLAVPHFVPHFIYPLACSTC